ncbi:MAG: single-stranded-DNA-specific exonuclease RecJ [Flavobacteriaceae bacterium]|nr:single-stranded-DNA-specific exonuclease RecJ [Flavobacteriaceae bacterium]
MRWTLKPKPEQSKVRSLQEVLKVDTITATLLVQRGIETYDQARHFFRPELNDLHNPFLMKDMDIAVSRIERAMSEEESIMVFGDYDVDGTTAVALLSTFLDDIHDRVTTYIPDRYDEGYGISIKGIDYADDNDISLIIALDCGIKAIDQVEYAKSKGIDFIICDHHRPGENLPDAIAILNPKREDCNYPYKELCGCGVGFKLIQAITEKQGETVEDIGFYLDLVATAIAADIVPMTGENRALAHYGLQVINSSPRPGIKALLASKKKDQYNITDVVFTLAPRINAAGRMKHGLYAVDLLRETDYSSAVIAAEAIDGFNTERRELDKMITEEAINIIISAGEEECDSTVVYKENWHKGVLGIVASRLIETYYRPTIVLTLSNGLITGSVRSVKGFDVYNALEKCKSHLDRFGGHKYAAGLTLKPENLSAFKTDFEEVVASTIQADQKIPEITIDMEIEFDEITPKLHRILSQMAPFGPGNMTPVFMSRNLADTGYAKQVGELANHLKARFVHGHSIKKLGAIGFGLGKKMELLRNRKKVMAAYSIDENHWNGRIDLQLKLRDLKST